jgi:hypothetical protein
MRKFFFTLLILGLIAGGIVFFLMSTTPKESTGVRFPLSASQRALVAQVPTSAESFALIPTAAALEGKLRANPISRDAIAAYAEKQSLPRPWMLGRADLLVWREAGGGTRYLLRLDPFRAAIVRVYRMIGGDIGDTLLINAPPGQQGIPEIDAILVLSDGLPPGDALAVQRSESRGAFPPIARPAVTSVTVSADAIELTSRAAATTTANGRRPTANAFPRSAILSAVFVDPPRLVEDLNRLFGTKVSSVLEDGGDIHIYDVKTGTLLPRPQGVIGVPANQARREAMASLPLARTAERDGRLLLSFDDSLDAYLKDAAEPARWPTGRWALRADAQRLAPILRKLGESLGLRVAAPRLHRAARDLDRWLSGLEQASVVEAADSVEGSAEVLRVRITAK